MTLNNVKNMVFNYILEHVSEEFDYNTDLFEEGLVNSLFAIQLMTFIEKSFSIKITMQDLDMENYKSINAIDSFVKRKSTGGI